MLEFWIPEGREPMESCPRFPPMSIVSRWRAMEYIGEGIPPDEAKRGIRGPVVDQDARIWSVTSESGTED